MSAEIFKYLVTGGYVALVYGLSWMGMRRTKEFAGFSIGNKDMSPYLVGVTLAAVSYTHLTLPTIYSV